MVFSLAIKTTLQGEDNIILYPQTIMSNVYSDSGDKTLDTVLDTFIKSTDVETIEDIDNDYVTKDYLTSVLANISGGSGSSGSSTTYTVENEELVITTTSTSVVTESEETLNL